ncbi:MAG: hypothetical protein AAF709_08030, partial [Pseudomonadota bacterium]
LTGEIDFNGCDGLVAQKIGDSVGSSASIDTAFLDRFAARWLGEFSCGDTRFSSELQLPKFASEDATGSLLYKKRDQFDTTTNQKIGFVLDGAEGQIGVRVVQRLSYKLNQQTYAPQSILMDADADRLTVLLDEPSCSPIVLRRDNPTDPVAILPVPASPSQATLFAPDIRDDGRVHLASTQAACDALNGWRAQITDADARLERAGSHVAGWGAWPTLFTDSNFEPFFGISYSRIAGTPDIAQLTRRLTKRDCRQLGLQIDLEIKVLQAAFGAKGTVFGSDFHAFQLAIADVEGDAELLQQLVAEIADVSSDATGLAELAGIDTQLQSLENLSEADEVEIAGLITQRRDEVKTVMDDAFLDMIAARSTLALADALRAEEIAVVRGDPDRDRISALIRDRVASLVDAEIIVPSQSLSGSELLDFTDRQRTRFKPLLRYTLVSESIAMLQNRIANETEDRVAAVVQRIDAAAVIADLRSSYKAVSTFTRDPRVAQYSQQLWSAYDQKAQTLLKAAISELPPRNNNRTERAKCGGPLAGLHKNADITAFLRGDRLSAYQAPRRSTLIYVAELAAEFRTYCPAALPPGISTLIAGKFINLNALTGDRDALAAEGWRLIAEGLQVLANPGPAMAEAINRDELRASAAADAQILLDRLRCTGPELRQMFSNIADWVKDPAIGIAQDEKNLFDICLDAVGNGLIMRETREYCSCASDRILRSAQQGFDRYLRASPQSHWRQITFLDRRLNQSLQMCRR